MTKVYTLLGAKGVSHALQCLPSLERFASQQFKLVVLDDSTLTERNIADLKQATNCEVLKYNERSSVINEKLRYFPNCLDFRKRFVLAQKLFDCTLIDDQPLIQFIDSDVLFIRPFEGFPVDPSHTQPNVFMSDIQSAYAISPLDLIKSSRFRFAKAINTGLFIFNRKDFDFELIERFLANNSNSKSFLRSECWTEQTCWALLAGKSRCRTWDADQLVIATPSSLQKLSERTVGIHFVSSVRHLLTDYSGSMSTSRVRLETQPSSNLCVSDLTLERLASKLKRRIKRRQNNAADTR